MPGAGRKGCLSTRSRPGVTRFAAPQRLNRTNPGRALRELQVKHDRLQRELRRKEKALAESAALLVLQKKLQPL